MGLLDSPSGRKQHKSVVPLIGGIAIYTSLLVGALIWGGREEVVVLVSQRDAIPIFILAAGVLVVGGVIACLGSIAMSMVRSCLKVSCSDSSVMNSHVSGIPE